MKKYKIILVALLTFTIFIHTQAFSKSQPPLCSRILISNNFTSYRTNYVKWANSWLRKKILGKKTIDYKKFKGQVFWQRPHLQEDKSFKVPKHFNTELFEVVSVLKGLHGGHRLVIRRTASWFSFSKNFNSNENGYDITQDLRLLPRLLGDKEAFYFGFEQLSDLLVTIPTVNEFNGAVNKFNQSLSMSDPRRIALSFHQQTDAFSERKDYVINYLQDSSLPISLSNKMFFHDISSHAFQGIFLDNHFHNRLQTFQQIWFNFINSPDANSLSMKELMPINEAMMKTFATQIDGLGEFPLMMIPKSLFIYFSTIGNEQMRNQPEKIAQLAWGDTITKYILQKSQRGGIVGYRGSHLFSLIQDGPRDFYFNELASYPNIQKAILEFMKKDKKLNPKNYKSLNYNFERQIKMLESVRDSQTKQQWEQTLSSLSLSRPFYERLQWLRQIIEPL